MQHVLLNNKTKQEKLSNIFELSHGIVVVLNFIFGNFDLFFVFICRIEIFTDMVTRKRERARKRPKETIDYCGKLLQVENSWMS